MDRKHVTALRRLHVFVDYQAERFSAKDRLEMIDAFDLANEAIEELEQMHAPCECCQQHPPAPPSSFCAVCIDRILRECNREHQQQPPRDELPY